ncbi:hypothetical protein Dimus_011053, partial [Dionaea muscipula]
CSPKRYADRGGGKSNSGQTFIAEEEKSRSLVGRKNIDGGQIVLGKETHPVSPLAPLMGEGTDWAGTDMVEEKRQFIACEGEESMLEGDMWQMGGGQN